jgi:hypothetical protein
LYRRLSKWVDSSHFLFDWSKQCFWISQNYVSCQW